MKRNRAFHKPEASGERGVQEVSVELEINVRVELRQQGAKGVIAAQLVGGAHVGEGALSDMLGFQQLRYEEIAVIHKGC